MVTSSNATSNATSKDKLLRKAYGDALRKRRADNGKLKQTALSWKAGLPAHAVGSLERGERPIVLEEIVRICKALDVEVATFLAEVRQHLRQMVEPLVQGLQAGKGAPEELRRAVDLVSDRAEKLVSSMTELDSDRGS